MIVAKKYPRTPATMCCLLTIFLANGKAFARSDRSVQKQPVATVEGIGIAVEKGFQGGGDALRAEGYDVDSLAIVESMNPRPAKSHLGTEHIGCPTGGSNREKKRIMVREENQSFRIPLRRCLRWTRQYPSGRAFRSACSM